MSVEVDEKYVVESALFSAGRPLSVEEISEATDIALNAVKKHMNELIKEYGSKGGSIEIAQVGAKYAMQLRPAYAVHATRLAQMEIPLKVLKTAALIAYHQPVAQSDLKKLIGAKVYEHVEELHALGLIRTKKVGQTKTITTTPRFNEYFGIAEITKDGIKNWLANKVGIKAPKGTLEDFLGKLDTHEGPDKDSEKPVGNEESKDGSDNVQEQIKQKGEKTEDSE
jgi:segregation and condensation protein B